MTERSERIDWLSAGWLSAGWLSAGWLSAGWLSADEPHGRTKRNGVWP